MKARRVVVLGVAALLAGAAAPRLSAVPEPGSRLSEIEEAATESLHVLRLPEWTSEDARRIEALEPPLDLGGGLWPVESAGGREADPVPVDPGWPTLGSLRASGSPDGADAVVGAEAWVGGARPESRLVDPLGRVGESYRRNIERFLGYHAAESSIETVVLVLASEGGLPEGIDTSEVWTRWFGEGSGAIVVYRFGDPEATGVEFGRDLVRRVGRGRLQALLDACVDDARLSGDPSAQLERFCVQFSIEVFRLEQDLRGGGDGGMRDRSAGARAFPVAGAAGAGARGTGGRLGGDGEAVAGAGAGGGARGIVVLGAAVVAGIGWRRLRRPEEFRFPEIEVPVRLGAAHAGSCQAVIGFGAGLPPGSGSVGGESGDDAGAGGGHA